MHKLRKVFFQLDVDIQRSVEEAASRTSSAVLVEGCLCRIHDALVSYKSRIGVRAKHEDFVSTHFYFCTLLACDLTEIRIYTCFHELLWHAVLFELFL